MKLISGSFIIFLSGMFVAFSVWLLALEHLGSFPVPSAIWNNALIEKKMDLAKGIESSKLVIISGSSAIEGISARQLEESLGFRCVNWGTSAGFGLDFMLWASKPALKPGDVALVALEYEHYDYRLHENVDLTLLQLIASECKEYFDTMPWLDGLRLKLACEYGYLYKSLVTKYNPMMPPENWGLPQFNDWGDPLDEHWSMQNQTPARKANVLKQRSRVLTEGISKESESWKVLVSYIDWCKRNDVILLATWPNICSWPDYKENGHYEKSLKEIRAFWTSHNIPVIGSPSGAMFSSKYFYNGMYHMNREGVVIRTERLIHDIERFRKKNNDDGLLNNL